jgi:hypothetical protein
LLLLPGFQSQSARVEFLSYPRVEPLLANYRFILPPELSGNTAANRSAWPDWLQNHDRQIRSRILRGEEDTFVYFVLFGVSFTDRPRVVAAAVASDETAGLIAGRIQDFLAASARPDTDRLNLLKNLPDALRGAGAGNAQSR